MNWRTILSGGNSVSLEWFYVHVALERSFGPGDVPQSGSYQVERRPAVGESIDDADSASSLKQESFERIVSSSACSDTDLGRLRSWGFLRYGSQPVWQPWRAFLGFQAAAARLSWG